MEALVEKAKKALTPEQKAEYETIGKYMYKNMDMYTATKVEAGNPVDFLAYATAALRSGFDPMELSKDELTALRDEYGNDWYVQFGLEKSDVPVNILEFGNGQSKISRNQKRFLERQMQKKKKG